jgi:large subunit ribosomal protein L44e
MKLPEVMKTYCPFCKVHTEHDVKLERKGKARSTTIGTRKFIRVKKGYGGSPRTPKKQVYKVGKRPVAILACKKCKKKHPKAYASRTKKKAEIK